MKKSQIISLLLIFVVFTAMTPVSVGLINGVAEKSAEAGAGSGWNPVQFVPSDDGIKIEPAPQQQQEEPQQEEEQPQKKCKWYQKCTLKKIVNNITKAVVKTAEAVYNGAVAIAEATVNFVTHPSLKTVTALGNTFVNVAVGVPQVGIGTLFGSSLANEGNCRIDNAQKAPANLGDIGIGANTSFTGRNCSNEDLPPFSPKFIPPGGDGGEGGGDSSASQGETVLVEIDESAPPSVDLRINGVDSFGASMEVPASFTLSWTSSNATSCVASNAWNGEKGIRGSENWSGVQRGAFIYTLTCSHDGGLSASDSISIQVVQVPRCSLSANPTQIVRPQQSTLSWSCQYADSCSIDNGVGSVNNVSGSTNVSPIQNTLYSLTCSDLDGSRSFSALVSVFISGLKEVLPR